MSEPFLGEIRLFVGNFSPRGWALCDGQILSLSSNTALFSLLGTQYGGDGRTTFALPDLRGRLAIHQGIGPGLTQRRIGEEAGAETATLTAADLPGHNHNLRSGGAADADFAVDHFPANTGGAHGYSLNGTLDVTMAEMTGPAGEATPEAHDNVMPFTCINYIIALEGTFPSRS